MCFGVLLMKSWKSSRVAALFVLAVAFETATAGDVNWDRRDFNGIWLIAGSALDNPAASVPVTGAPASEPDPSDDWGFDTRPTLKGKFRQDYQQRKRADRKAGRDFLVTCKPNGMPALLAGPYGNEILQNKKQINWFQEFPAKRGAFILMADRIRTPRSIPLR